MVLLRICQELKNIFFHVSNALSELVENAIVIFDLERGKRGMNAINICISERTAD